jgi:hypothetical protein
VASTGRRPGPTSSSTTAPDLWFARSLARKHSLISDFTVKANQKNLYQALKKLPWKDVPARTTRNTGHGRREPRTIKVAERPAWIEFEDAAQVAQLRRTT